MGHINVSELEGVREDEHGDSKNWGRHGNLDLHGCAFDRFTNILEYKAKVDGIEVVEVAERDTSKTCCVCGREDDSQRVERGLYVCASCDAAFNADMNGAENIRLDINQSNSESASSLGEDRSTGWLAQPGVYLHDLSSGFQPQAQVVDSKPYYPNPSVRCRGIPAPSGAGGCQVLKNDHQDMPHGETTAPAEDVRELDVREINGEPFGDIITALEELPADGTLLLTSSFEPVPLYAVLEGKGFAHETEHVADDEWRVAVTHA